MVTPLRNPHGAAAAALALLVLASPSAAAQQVGGQWDDLHHVTGTTEFGAFGGLLAGGGGFNNDGIVDFPVGGISEAPGGRNNAGAAYAYSSADGTTLWSIEDLGCLGGVMGVGAREVIQRNPSPVDELGQGVRCSRECLLDVSIHLDKQLTDFHGTIRPPQFNEL